jgi:predicted DNA-binding antitoxin AbrB/MazE fold protein
MTETFTAVYEGGVLVPLQSPGLKERQSVRLQIVPARVSITAAIARRKVIRFVLDNVSYLMNAEQPTLIEADRLVWRVPVTLTYPTLGNVGQVGTLDVDAENGELLTSPDTIAELTEHARELAAHLPPETTSSI